MHRPLRRRSHHRFHLPLFQIPLASIGSQILHRKYQGRLKVQKNKFEKNCELKLATVGGISEEKLGLTHLLLQFLLLFDSKG